MIIPDKVFTIAIIENDQLFNKPIMQRVSCEQIYTFKTFY